MKNRIVCCLALLLFMMPPELSAVNWVLVKSSRILGWTLEEYIEADTAVEQDGNIRFWYVEKIIKPLGAEQRVLKIEDATATRQVRVLETHLFVNGQLKKSKIDKPGDFKDDSKLKDPLAAALKHVKQGSDTGPVPTPP